MLPHVILLNAADSEGTRSFSLMHAYAHILLGEEGGDGRGGTGSGGGGGCICKEDGFHGWSHCRRGDRTVGQGGCSGGNSSGIKAAEMWCDRFAAAVLMPHGPFVDELERAEDDRAAAGCAGGWVAARIAASRLSERFRVSMYAAAVRAIAVRQGQEGKRRRWRRIVAEVSNTGGASCWHGRSGSGGGVLAGVDKKRDPGEYCVHRLGRRFAGLVLLAHERGEETAHEVTVLLDIGYDDIDDVQGAL